MDYFGPFVLGFFFHTCSSVFHDMQSRPIHLLNSFTYLGRSLCTPAIPILVSSNLFLLASLHYCEMGVMEISYSNSSVWVWQIAYGEQKKEGEWGRMDERMNKWSDKGTKEKKIKKIWESFCLKTPDPSPTPLRNSLSVRWTQSSYRSGWKSLREAGGFLFLTSSPTC